MSMMTPSPGTFRRVVGIVRIAAGLLVLVSIIIQIVDESLNDGFLPGEYFAYFTNESSVMTIVVLIAGGIYALGHVTDTCLLTNVRVAILSYEIVTTLVYNLLLRSYFTSSGFQGIHWPSEVLHVAIPLFVVVDWILAPGRIAVRWKALWFVAIYPTAWLLFTLVRGVITGWFPYPFLEPAQPGGWIAVLGFSAGVAAIILGLAAIGILISRRFAGLRSQRVQAAA